MPGCESYRAVEPYPFSRMIQIFEVLWEIEDSYANQSARSTNCADLLCNDLFQHESSVVLHQTSRPTFACIDNIEENPVEQMRTTHNSDTNTVARKTQFASTPSREDYVS